MKIQDLIFVAIFLILFYKRKSAVTAGMGIICLALSMFLFKFQIFFTAEHLTWYAASFFLLSGFQLTQKIKEK